MAGKSGFSRFAHRFILYAALFRVASKDGLRIQPFAAERSLYSCEYSLYSLDKSEYSAYNSCILLIQEVRYDLRK